VKEDYISEAVISLLCIALTQLAVATDKTSLDLSSLKPHSL